MIKLIVGKKGSGKTKLLIDMVTKAANTSDGNVVCIEKEPKLTFDIPSSVRLMETCKDAIEGYGEFYGYVAGVLSGNFDITDLFIDSTLKIGGKDLNELAGFLAKLSSSIASREVNVVLTVSADKEELPECLAPYVL